MLRAVANIPEYIGSFTYANLPAASAYSGFRAFCSDLGANGCDVRSNGTRWRPVNGQANLAVMGAAITGIGQTESIVLQTKLPVAAWQANDLIRISVAGGKSGTTNSSLIYVHVGTAGTTADTQITGINAIGFIGTSGLYSGGMYDLKLVSNTSAERVGPNAGTAPTFSVGSTVAQAAATTISDASANALWITVGMASNGATDTVSAVECAIQLITP